MSRFLYWTILVGDEPTSFRAAEAADLKPTLVQLQRTNPEARMVWFERGRIWGSPAEANAARLGERASSRSRPSTWRPGGKHVDPRQKYKDAKKAKWTRFKDGIRQRAEGRRGDRPPPVAESGPKRTTDEILADWKPPPPKSPGDRPREPTAAAPVERDRTQRDTRPPPQRDTPWRPKAEGDRFEKRRPWGAKPEGARSEAKRPWSPKPPKPDGARGETRRPWSPKPESDRPRRPWGSKPDAARSEGRRPAGSKPAGAKSGGPRGGSSKFGGPRPPRPRTRDDRAPRKPRKD